MCSERNQHLPPNITYLARTLLIISISLGILLTLRSSLRGSFRSAFATFSVGGFGDTGFGDDLLLDKGPGVGSRAWVGHVEGFGELVVVDLLGVSDIGNFALMMRGPTFGSSVMQPQAFAMISSSRGVKSFSAIVFEVDGVFVDVGMVRVDGVFGM